MVMVDMVCNRNKIIDFWNGAYAMVQHLKLLAPPISMWIQQSFNGWLIGTDTISWVSTNTFLS